MEEAGTDVKSRTETPGVTLDDGGVGAGFWVGVNEGIEIDGEPKLEDKQGIESRDKGWDGVTGVDGRVRTG